MGLVNARAGIGFSDPPCSVSRLGGRRRLGTALATANLAMPHPTAGQGYQPRAEAFMESVPVDHRPDHFYFYPGDGSFCQLGTASAAYIKRRLEPGGILSPHPL